MTKPCAVCGQDVEIDEQDEDEIIVCSEKCLRELGFSPESYEVDKRTLN